jgi:TrmH family RNA methyltransferase
MIESSHNEKLKLIRKLRERKQREREGAFVSEGEDLVEAGLAAGAEPRFLLTAAGSGLGGEEVEPELLAAASSLGSGTRAIAVWPQRWAEPGGSSCLYLHGVGDPGNVGTIVRTVDALLGGSVVLGPDCADPFSSKAVRASMGSIFSAAAGKGRIGETPAPRAALVAHGAQAPRRWAGTRLPRGGARRRRWSPAIASSGDDPAASGRPESLTSPLAQFVVSA